MWIAVTAPAVILRGVLVVGAVAAGWGIAGIAGIAGGSAARAQGVARRYVEVPTGGLELPATPLAGEHDARAVTINPGGLALIRGSDLALALDLEDTGVTPAAGQGFGAYGATTFGGGVLPRLGIGLGLEWLQPARDQLTPDPGQPFRLTVGLAAALGSNAGAGVAWHHFHEDGTLGGVNSFDLGVSWRADNYLAFGGVLRDVATSAIAGVPVQRRYEAEAVLRPAGSDVVEAGFGGRIGETRGDVDGWIRASLRVARGVYLQAEVESRALQTLADTGIGIQEQDGRELRATFGVALSFGEFGVTAQATGLRDLDGKDHALGGTVIVHARSLGPASVAGPPDHIERIELAGTIGTRELTALVVRLRAIGRDPTAKAVVVTFDGPSAGWATLEELRDELMRLRGAGVKIFAYMTSGTGRDYYVATAAHKIYIDPVGGLRLVGMAGTTMYFRGTFDLLGVVPQFEKIAEYKSAPEQFTETGPTEVAARMRGELYDSIWDRWVATVAEARHLTRDQVLAVVNAGPYTAGALAGDPTLVDAVAGPDKISQLIISELGEAISIGTPEAERPDRWQRPGIAIIYVDGDITDGKSRSVPVLGESLAGGETLIDAVVAARNDPRIAAIVLRINSPGGSAVASELISREVFATRGVKPILCSMSDLAASGGYFVAAGCELIFAEPMTITGSIGIFSGKFDLGGLAGKLGITTDTFKRGARADLESMYRPYTDDERAVVKDGLRYMYGRFVGAVAEGRAMTKDAVDAVGRGHVWTGAQAQPIRLVDRLGGLEDAIDEARRRVGLSPGTKVQLFELPGAPSSLLGSLGKLIGVQDAAPDLAALAALADLPVLRELVRGVPASILVAPSVPQTRLPFDIAWQ
ncbi:MAG TPA: signal peptide peptidase SppA [Kofleriaceae bacterium]|jgi:protease-4|nr:signal peptide peptidase SppA [Kofleriaceae bacterium]